MHPGIALGLEIPPFKTGPIMITRRLTRFITALGLVLGTAVATNAHAQGVTTGGVNGFVTDSAGNALEGVQITITNRTTGFTTPKTHST